MIDSAKLIAIISLNNALLSFKSLIAFDSEIMAKKGYNIWTIFRIFFGNQTKQNNTNIKAFLTKIVKNATYKPSTKFT
jgi:hypothetical protein